MEYPLQSVSNSKYPVFKIIGSNLMLEYFMLWCHEHEIPLSEYNSLFRDDYEHCLMPCYAYDEQQPENIRLQTLASDVYQVDTVYDLEQDLQLVQDLVKGLKQIRLATIEKEERKHRLHVHMQSMHHKFRLN